MPPKPKDEGQRARFIDAARRINADEDEAAFRAKLAVIARQKPKDEPKPEKPSPPRGRRKQS